MSTQKSPAVTVEDWGTLSQDILDRLEADRDKVALRRVVDGAWVDVTLAQFHAEVIAAAKGLLADGIAHRDRVAILAKTRYEWTVLDYANWWIGAVTVPIYETSSASQIAWILADSGATHIFYENEDHRLRIEEARRETPELTSIRPLGDVLTSLAAEGVDIDDEIVEKRRAAVVPGDFATMIYTSGTTGRPKGCELTHANFRAELAGAKIRLDAMFAADGASTLLFLPLAHVFARIIQVGAIRYGSVLGHTADIANLVDHLGQFRPTFILAVPRVFEKVFNSASTKAYAEGKGRIFDAAVRTAIAYSRATETGRASLALKSKHALYSKLVYSKLRNALGGRAEFAISGGAPLGDRLGHFYRGIGVNVLEGYGLTESTAALTVNHPGAQRIGTVGPPMPGVEVRIAEDGELQFRGPQVFVGYWNAEAATRNVLSEDGWFSTGDLGEVTEDGFVKITGRKKELIVTAGGKNVSPAILEDRVRSHSLVSQCLVVGEGKPFVAALVTIDREAWEGDLDDPALLEQVQKAVDDANSQVSRAEAIRKFAILEEDWTEENGYLTPSFKVKRHMVVRDLHDRIEALYVR
ncbi:AMP-dependent synthetase/ligase [Aeromicrobium duanguangcaii]|uniref:Acyl-CoA synthetase n=1 Tax=Aeromicrobium duanguangcaii TaxID=2968086 RepID=A0ABY5KKS1_9ACTN|nr:AMP-dependent synthetase/ligase [Aeromicrobium duanguangcaii]MCD9153278.1 AMP-dependent synthetase/ligase [Aeromicrobium duanguangcaii]UUI69625.1 AMP-dependent synthetase/ligase [Aeromicrobium duanguangcaii]